MKKFKKIIYVVSCVFIFTGSIALTGCGHSHSHHGSSNQYDSNSHHDAHSHTPHDGILTPFFDSKSLVGDVELKLHDDKGDLELWLTDLRTKAPYDIPLDAQIKVIFLDMAGKEIWLTARNKTNNEDENGKGNIRNGKTNYFIFPGDSNESADFLVGKHFSSNVVVSFIVGGTSFKTASFVLTPHTH